MSFRIKPNAGESDATCCVTQCVLPSVILDDTRRYAEGRIGWCDDHWTRRHKDEDVTWVAEQLAPHGNDPVHLDYLRQLLGVKR